MEKRVCTSLSDHLWTAQIEIDSITVVLGQKSSLKEHLRVIGTKLEERQYDTVAW